MLNRENRSRLIIPIYSLQKPAKVKMTKKNIIKASKNTISYSFKYEVYQLTNEE